MMQVQISFLAFVQEWFQPVVDVTFILVRHDIDIDTDLRPPGNLGDQLGRRMNVQGQR